MAWLAALGRIDTADPDSQRSEVESVTIDYVRHCSFNRLCSRRLAGNSEAQRQGKQGSSGHAGHSKRLLITLQTVHSGLAPGEWPRFAFALW